MEQLLFRSTLSGAHGTAAVAKHMEQSTCCRAREASAPRSRWSTCNGDSLFPGSHGATALPQQMEKYSPSTQSKSPHNQTSPTTQQKRMATTAARDLRSSLDGLRLVDADSCHPDSRLKACFHYGCALRCVASDSQR